MVAESEVVCCGCCGIDAEAPKEHRGGAKVIVRDVCVICSGICVVDCCVLVLVHNIPSSKVECVFKCNGGSR